MKLPSTMATLLATAALSCAAVFASETSTAWTLQLKLTAADGAIPYHQFGARTAINGDTALIAAWENGGSGAVYVFIRSGSSWTLQQELRAPDSGPYDEFGSGVALSGDTALIGALDHNNGQGAAYVFTRSGTTWTKQQELAAIDGVAGDRFGSAVSLDGNSAIIGAQSANSGKGAAYVFTFSGQTWSQQQKLTSVDGSSFGGAVSLSGDAALIGAFSSQTAYVYTRSGNNWALQQEFTDTTSPSAFGYSVSLDGDTALIGAYQENSILGAAYVYTRSKDVWTLQQKLTGVTGSASAFGASVALSGDTAVIGAAAASANKGSAHLFMRVGTTWTRRQVLTASDGAAGDNFGNAVALNGGTGVAGALYNGSSIQGSAYVFTGPISQTITFTTPAPAKASYNQTFTVAATASSGLPVALTSAGNCTNSGAAYTMTSGTGSCKIVADQPGDAQYLPAATTREFTIATKAAPAVTFTGAPAESAYQSTFMVAATSDASTSATLSAAGPCSVAGATVTITSGTGSCRLTAKWAADSNYLAASANQMTSASKLIPGIAWTAPAAIVYGTAIGSVQLNATASYGGTSVPGMLTYTPPAGSIPMAGNQKLSVKFSPTASADYANVSASVTLVVNPVGTTTRITGTTPAAPKTGSPVGIHFTVTAGFGAATGVVTVSSSTGESCHSTLSGGNGTCSITFATAGSRTLTANYGGSKNDQSSASSGFALSVGQ